MTPAEPEVARPAPSWIPAGAILARGLMSLFGSPWGAPAGHVGRGQDPLPLGAGHMSPAEPEVAPGGHVTAAEPEVPRPAPSWIPAAAILARGRRRLDSGTNEPLREPLARPSRS